MSRGSLGGVEQQGARGATEGSHEPRATPAAHIAQAALAAAAIGLVLVAAGGWTERSRFADEPAAPAHPHAWFVNVNDSPAGELALLPGVGPETARRIVAWRRDHGDFRRIDDLLRVRGIGPATLARIAPWVEVVPAPG